MTGPSGCGKTNLLLNFIYDWMDFDRLYVCAKDIFEPKYVTLRERYSMFDGLEEEDIRDCKHKKELLELYRKFGNKKTLFTNELDEFASVDDLDSSVRNLVIFDDCVTEKDQKPIEDFFIRGRKKNASVIYLSQSYYSTPLNIRKNCNYFVFFRLQPREIQQILREVDGNLSPKEFKAMYDKSVRVPFDFFMLDLTNPELRYRRNFEPWKKNSINGCTSTGKATSSTATSA